MERNQQYASIEEAFAALPADIQEHSLRVEKYADLVFMEVCASDEYIMNMNSRVRLRYENRSMIGLAAKYHDVGKILVPSVYHFAAPDFSPEETALYYRHSLGGENLARNVMKEQKGYTPVLIDTVCEGIVAHHEHWDGSGSPRKFKGEDIPIVGRIIAVANELDYLLMNTRTETPVATAIDKMMQESGTRFDPVIMGLMYEAKFKIEKIFALYKEASRAIPQAPHVIRRKTKRPMWLKYRPIMNTKEKKMKAVEADMVFRRGKENVGFSDVEKLLKQSKKVWEAQLCFVVEACDMVKRMRTCEVGGKFVAINCVNGFWKKKGAGTAISKLLSDIDAEPDSVCFILRGEEAAMPSANVIENCEKLRNAGCRIMYSGVPLSDVDIETVARTCATHLCLNADKMERAEKYAAKLKKITESGVIVLAEGADKHRHFAVLASAGIQYAYGDLIGEYESESDFIAGELAASN